MKKIEINEGSSIWKLVTFWGIELCPDNFCDLLGKSIRNLLILTFLVGFLSAWAGAVVGEVTAMFVVGYNGLGIGTIILVVVLAAIAVICAFAGIHYLCTSSETTAKYRENINVIHESIKNKWCPLVEEVPCKKDN